MSTRRASSVPTRFTSRPKFSGSESIAYRREPAARSLRTDLVSELKEPRYPNPRLHRQRPRHGGPRRNTWRLIGVDGSVHGRSARVRSSFSVEATAAVRAVLGKCGSVGFRRRASAAGRSGLSSGARSITRGRPNSSEIWLSCSLTSRHCRAEIGRPAEPGDPGLGPPHPSPDRVQRYLDLLVDGCADSVLSKLCNQGEELSQIMCHGTPCRALIFGGFHVFDQCDDRDWPVSAPAVSRLSRSAGGRAGMATVGQ